MRLPNRVSQYVRQHSKAIWPIPRTWQGQELLAEVLNRSGFDTDADRDVFPVAGDFNLSGHLHAISFSQRLDQAVRATDYHVNGTGVILQRERGTPTRPS